MNVRFVGRPVFFKVSIIFVALHILFILILGNITAFAPDESGYAEIFSRLYSSDFSFEGQGGWSSGNVLFLRLLYLPAKIFSILGCSNLISVRLLSLICAYLAFYLLVKQINEPILLRLHSSWWLVIAFLTPSIFVWTSLGLRESFILLWLVAIFNYAARVLKSPSWRNFVFLTLSSSALCLTKDYLYMFIVISFISSFFLIWIFTRKFNGSYFKAIAFILLPLLFFPSISVGFIKSGQSLILSRMASSTDIELGTGTGTGTETETASGTVLVAVRGQTLHALVSQLESNDFLLWLTSRTGIQELLEAKAKASYLPANSKELTKNVDQLRAEPASLRYPLTIFESSAKFLFMPIPFLDNGSFFLNLQSYESPVWYLFYILLLFIIFGLLRGTVRRDFITIVACIFSILFIIESSLIEVNVGTSIRHRSVLMIGILVAIVNQRRIKAGSHVK
jgi:hypothetical protein